MTKPLMNAVGLTVAIAFGAFSSNDAGQAQQPPGTNSEAINVPIAQPLSNAVQQNFLPTSPGVQKPPPQPANTNSSGGLATSSMAGLPSVIDPKAKPSFLSQYIKQDLSQIDINQDIAVQPGCGNWLIHVIDYPGNDAPRLAREMVMELRNNPKYKLNAYVFTKGLKERQDELKQIEDNKEFQRKALAAIPDLPPDTRVHIPFTRSNFEIQCAVLVGGYKDMDSAKAACLQIKKLGIPDPNKVKLATFFTGKEGADGKLINKGEDKLTQESVNPFQFAIPVANPSMKVERANGITAEDIALMRKLNANEQYNLLSCPKKYTLVVKQFALPITIRPANSGKSLMEERQAAKSTNEAAEKAGYQASVLARMLRKDNLEAYVLHTKYCSYVTVGSYDNENDPRMLQAQERLPQYINQVLEKIDPKLINEIKVVARPVLMSVPH